MFKNQIDNHEFTEKVAIDKKYLLRNMAFKFKTLNLTLYAK